MQDNPQATLPSNLEAEAMVLGSLLISPDTILRIPSLTRADFYRESNGWIFQAMHRLNERKLPIDLVLLATELESTGRLIEIGGPSYLTGLISATNTAMYIEYYAGLVLDCSSRRRQIAAAGRIAGLAYDLATPVEDVRESAQRLILDATADQSKAGPQSVASFLPDVVEEIFNRTDNPNLPMGLPTGFSALDKLLQGLHKTDLIILAGRPGMGKSSLGVGMAYNAAKFHAARVAIFSLEMSSQQLVYRLLSLETGIDSGRLKSGRIDETEQAILMEAGNSLGRYDIQIDEAPGLTVADLRSRCHRLNAESGLDLIVVDYLQLMAGGHGNGGNREQEIAYISRSLKALAKELFVPVLALCQLNRGVESRQDKRPMLSDLRESGGIENDADVVMMLYRDDYYNEDSTAMNIAELIVAKHRNGATGKINLYFRKELTQFADLEINRVEF